MTRKNHPAQDRASRFLFTSSYEDWENDGYIHLD